MLNLLGTLFIGLIVGWVARFLLPGKQALGLIMTSLLGIAGSLVATYGGQFLGIYHAAEGAGFIGAVVGAFLILFIVNRLRK